MKKLKIILIIAVSVFLFNVTVSYSSPRNVLIEYVTGTWCGNCPCGHQTLNSINSQYPQTIVLAYHAFNSDPWKNFNGNEIVSLLNLVATPTAVIDRNFTANNTDYTQWITATQNRYTSSPDSKIDLNVISKSFNESTREFNLTVNAAPLEDLSGQYKINFVIVENDLIYQQNFYSQCGTPGIVQNYVHDHVVRNMVNNASGEALNSGNIWNMNQTISKNISTPVNDGWKADNCEVVIFVYKDSAPLSSANIEQAIKESVTGTVGIPGNETEAPNNFTLSQNYPNPFNPVTVIRYSIPSDVKGQTSNVKLIVYNYLGSEVATLVSEKQNAGNYEVKFNGSNLASGVYLYRLESRGVTLTKSMLLVK